MQKLLDKLGKMNSLTLAALIVTAILLVFAFIIGMAVLTHGWFLLVVLFCALVAFVWAGLEGHL